MNRPKPDGRVAILAAMVQELRPVVRRYGLRGESGGLRGRAGGHELAAAVTTMGTAAATRSAGRLLDAFPADHVIVVGIAGGIATDLAIGDLLQPERVVDSAGGVFHPTPLGAAAPRGILRTGDELLTEPAAIERLRAEGVVAVDMETAAIAAVAEARGLPWSVLRAVSDLAGDVPPDVLGLARPDGSGDPAAVARLLLTRPWRIPRLARLARGSGLAIRNSTGALFAALEDPPGPS